MIGEPKMGNFENENPHKPEKETSAEIKNEALPSEDSSEDNKNKPDISNLMKTPEKEKMVYKCLECKKYYGENADKGEAVKNNELPDFTISHGFCSEECTKKHLDKAFKKQ